MIIFSQDLKI